MYTRVSGVWRDSNNIYTNVNGIWKECFSMYTRVSGIWKQVHYNHTTQKTLYSGTIYGNLTSPGSASIASINGLNVNCSGLTKDNGSLIIDLYISDPSKILSTESQLEIGSSNNADVEEWYYKAFISPTINVTSTWTTFVIPLFWFGGADTNVNVTSIKRVRWYVYFTDSNQRVAWSNARIAYTP